MTNSLRVAIVGASGIGRHHANWHDAVGSTVVAFVGTTPERCHESAQVLTKTFGFQGQAYTSLDEMLQQERPDVVDICSPNETHYDVATRALAADCHVLCEKPLVWDASLSAHQILEQAERLQDMASRANRHLGMCSQLAGLLPQYDNLVGPSDRPCSFEAVLETTCASLRSARDVWTDMGPHPISLILARFPTADLDLSTVTRSLHGHEAKVTFDVITNGHRCQCSVIVRDLPGPPLQRRFGFDGRCVDIAGQPGADGYYRCVLRGDGMEDEGTDPMHLLIGQFARTVQGAEKTPIVTAATAVQNLQMQLGVVGHD